MVSLNINSDGNFEAIQKDRPPSIYLDLCALMDIADDSQKADRLVKFLIQRGGTLYLSFMHLLEFSKVESPQHAMNIESLLESINPQIFFIDAIPKNVIDRENQLIKREGPLVSPHGDMKLLKYFITLKRKTLDPLNPKGLFSNLNDNRLKEIRETFLQDSINEINRLRGRRDNDQQYKISLQNFPRGNSFQRSTRYIWQDLVNSLIRDKNIQFNNTNHLKDLFHTAVPLAYGDIVLLDRTWATKAEQVINRLRKTDHQEATAKVFSMKNIDDFLAFLST